MSGGLSGSQSGAVNVDRFASWVGERRRSNDWHEYVYSGKLSRSDIAAECEFAVSVLRQNPAVRGALATLEDDLRKQGVLPTAAEAASNQHSTPETVGTAADSNASLAAEARAALVASSAAMRLKALEEQNASLRAEILHLKAKLKRYALLDQHLGETGRLLPP